jgi:predicted ATPase/DNA-binding SARP family transcriptional activator
MTERKPEAVRVRMLGGFSVRVGSRAIGQNEWRRKKVADLIKLLALAPSNRLHREQVMDNLWPQLGKRAASNNLSVTLHATRRVLDPAASHRYLASEEASLVLGPEGALWVDVDSFEEAAATARREREPAAYRAALDLYSGELLPADRYEEWTEERRQELRQLNLALLAELASIHEQRGEHGPAIEALRRLTTAEPAREEAHAGLMRLYALSGRQFEALEQYEVLEGALAREAGAEPTAASRALRKQIARGELSPPAGGTRLEGDIAAVAGAGKHNLPAPRSSFVGRQREMGEIKRALAMTRLLTLTGVGGSGKTRLALEVGRDLVGVYPDGVWLVELASLSDPALVPQVVAGALEVPERPGEPLTDELASISGQALVPKAVAEALEVPERPGEPLADTLAEVLRDRQLLLVVDNCEHLLEATGRLVDTLLDACPRLRVLATSREPLGVAGELSWLVPSLSVPDEGPSTVEGVEGYESARLFTARASYSSRDFSLTSENARAVATICRRLDGIPLAIELAAARIGPLSAEQIARRLDGSLVLLTGGVRTVVPRHRTLRGALDWSHELLSGEEKKLFERLSVFAGGWTLEAAEAVGVGGSVAESEVLDLLSALVEKSLVVPKGSDEEGVRYRLLEPVRQYAMEKLQQSGEIEAVRRRHAMWYLALAEAAEPELVGAEQEAWFRRLEAEHNNLRAALRWCLDRGEPEFGLRLAGTLGREFWRVRGRLREGLGWLDAALEKGKDASPARARALACAGWMAWQWLDFDLSRSLSEEALALARGFGEEQATAAIVLHNLGMVEIYSRMRPAEAWGFLEQSLALWRELGDNVGAGRVLQRMGLISVVRHDFGRAEAPCFEVPATGWGSRSHSGWEGSRRWAKTNTNE